MANPAVKKQQPPKKRPPRKKSTAELLREKKMEALQESITQMERELTELTAAQMALLHIDLVGISVTHRLFGSGIISSRQGTAITVELGSQTKKFVFPSAFMNAYLKTDDETTNACLASYADLANKIKDIRASISATQSTLRVLANR